MAANAAAGAGNAAAALTFPSTMDIKITDILTVAGRQYSIFRHIDNTAYIWGLVSSALEATNRGSGAGAGATGGTLRFGHGAVHEGQET